MLNNRSSPLVGMQNVASSLEDKVWQFHIKLSGFLINWAPGKPEMWRNLKCITSERGHSGKSVLCLTPTCDILENGKTVGMVKGPVVSMVGEGHREQADQRGFLRYKKKKNKKTLIMRWWICAIMPLSKSIDYAKPRGSPKVNCGLWVIMLSVWAHQLQPMFRSGEGFWY